MDTPFAVATAAAAAVTAGTAGEGQLDDGKRGTPTAAHPAPPAPPQKSPPPSTTAPPYSLPPSRVVLLASLAVASIFAVAGCRVLGPLVFPAVGGGGDGRSSNGFLTADGARAAAVDFLSQISLPPLVRVGSVASASTNSASAPADEEKSSKLNDVLSAASLDYDWHMKSYIDLSGGGRDAFVAYQDSSDYIAPFRKWTVRVFRELEFEESVVSLAVDGHPVSFHATLNESTVLPDLSKKQAVKSARAFLAERFPRWATLNLTVASHSQKRVSPSNRREHTLVFKDDSVKVADAPLMVVATVSGNIVSTVDPYFQIPPDFHLRFSRMRASNKHIEGISRLFLNVAKSVAMTGAVWYLIGTNSLRLKLAVRISLVYTLLVLADSLNGFDKIWLFYDTSVSRLTFLTRRTMQSLVAAFLVPFDIILNVSVADGLTGLAFPRLPALSSILGSLVKGRPHPLAAEQIFVASALVPLQLLYVYAFYGFTTRHFGFWVPTVAVTDAAAISTFFPGLSTLRRATSAGLQEELLFRAVFIAGFTLCGNYFRRRKAFFVLGFIVQALVFGGAHAGYATQPSYARVIELFVPSMVFGWLYVRYGLLACFLTHFQYDLVLMAAPYFGADSGRFWGSQLFIIIFTVGPVLLCLPSLVSAIRGKSASAIPPLKPYSYFNGDDYSSDTSDDAASDSWPLPRIPPSRVLRRYAFLLGATSLIAIALVRNPRITEVRPTLHLSKQDALKAALDVQASLNLTHMLNATRFAMSLADSPAEEVASAVSMWLALAFSSSSSGIPGAPWYTVARVQDDSKLVSYYLNRYVHGSAEHAGLDVRLADEPFFAIPAWEITTKHVFDLPSQDEAGQAEQRPQSLYDGSGEDAHSSINTELRRKSEEFTVSFDRNGRLMNLHYSVGGSVPGAQMEESEAIELATLFLTCSFPSDDTDPPFQEAAPLCSGLALSPDDLRLKTTVASDGPSRRDWHVQFENLRYEGLPKDAKLVHTISVSNHKVVAYFSTLEQTQAYKKNVRDSRAANSLPSSVFFAIRVVFSAGILGYIYLQIVNHGLDSRLFCAFFAVCLTRDVLDAVVGVPDTISQVVGFNPVKPQLLTLLANSAVSAVLRATFLAVGSSLVVAPFAVANRRMRPTAGTTTVSLPRDLPVLVALAATLAGFDHLLFEFTSTFLRTTPGAFNVVPFHLHHVNPARPIAAAIAAGRFLHDIASAGFALAIQHFLVHVARPSSPSSSSTTGSRGGWHARVREPAALAAFFLVFYASDFSSNGSDADSAGETALFVLRSTVAFVAPVFAKYFLATRLCGVDALRLVVPMYGALKRSLAVAEFAWAQRGAESDGGDGVPWQSLAGEVASRWAVAVAAVWVLHRFLQVGVVDHVEDGGSGGREGAAGEGSGVGGKEKVE